MATLRLYGAPLSQPFRSVAWTMLQLGVPFEMKLTVPGVDGETGTTHDSFRSLTPHRGTHVPLLRYCPKDEAAEKMPSVVVESPSIMIHVCERYGGQAMAGNTRGGPVLYPPKGTLEKAMVDSYLHWHHSHTRFLAKKFIPRVIPHMYVGSSPRDDEKIEQILRQLDTGWLHHDEEKRPFIGGLTQPTIADFLAYAEVCTVTYTKTVSLENHSRVQAWADRMTQVPFHDDVHKSVMILGSMADGDYDPEDVPALRKRLKAATKGGFQAITAAQAKFTAMTDWEV